MNLLTMRQLLARVPVSRGTIYNLMRDEGFPRPTKVGSRSLWPLDAVDAWVKERGQ